MADEDIVVEVEDAPPEDNIVVEKEVTKPETGEKVETKVADSTAQAAEAIKKQLEEYEANLAAERKLREEASRRADAAETEVTEVRKRVTESEMDAVDNAITALNSEKEVIKSRLRTAMAEGDVEETIKANEELSTTISRLAELKAGKTYIEQQKTAPKAAPVSSDPKEAYLARFAPPAQKYLRDRPQLIDDPRMNKRMIAAHYEAEADGYVANTPAYFDFIDTKLGLKSSEARPVTTTTTTQAGIPAAPPRRESVSAPVSRTSEGATVIKLTAGEARAATDGTLIYTHGPNKGQPIGVKEYARRKASMMREGRYSEGAQ